jgi:hypothetical protein
MIALRDLAEESMHRAMQPLSFTIGSVPFHFRKPVRCFDSIRTVKAQSMTFRITLESPWRPSVNYWCPLKKPG